jgi:hypothetical protein
MSQPKYSKKRIYIFGLIALSIPISFALFQNVIYYTPNLQLKIIESPPGINYFGYFASAAEGVGKGDYIKEVSGRSDTVFISVETDPSGIPTKLFLSKLKEAQSLNLAVILMVQNLLFTWHTSRLASGYTEHFQRFRDSIRSYDYMIAAYYIFDEPYWNNLVSPGWGNVAPSVLYHHLVQATQVVTDMTSKPTIIIFSGMEVSPDPGVNPGFKLPPNVSWIGTDCYLSDNCNDARVHNAFNLLASSKSAKQRLVIALDAYWHRLPNSSSSVPSMAPPSQQTQSSIIQRIQLWQQVITQTSDVVAIFPFLYQTGTDDSFSGWGAEDMPDILNWLDIYFAGLRGDVACDVDDLVRIRNGHARWHNAPMCVARCKGHDLVRFDVVGREIARWRNAPPPYCP